MSENIELKIKEAFVSYRNDLLKKIEVRIEEMKEDNNDHYEMYSLLGFSEDKAQKIDEYQNIGRLLFKALGASLEEVVILCFKEKYPQLSERMRIENTVSQKPKTVEIDCLVGKIAYEIKWRDATTDGDHIAKEKTRIKVIKDAGYHPVRIMLFKPNREQAIKVQLGIEAAYAEVDGEYYSGEQAWVYIYKQTGIDLKKILTKLEKEIQ